MSQPAGRTITQIAVTSHNDRDYLYALAADGSVWRMAIELGYTWFLLPALPAEGPGQPGPLPQGAPGTASIP